MIKSQIRKRILKIRKGNDNQNLEINFKYILEILKKEKINKKIIGAYYPYNHEVNVLKILKKFEKQNFLITLPKIKKKFQMDFFYWSTKNPLLVNKYGIPEPTSGKVKYPSILLVPLVAYDQHLNRIGYGGGFYDRYIKKAGKNRKIITIGLAYSFQKVKKIPINKFDMKLNYIVTEKEN